jgi:hypothetical protein
MLIIVWPVTVKILLIADVNGMYHAGQFFRERIILNHENNTVSAIVIQ